MEWAMAEILHNPKTLFEARVEFEKTIGKGKQVKESDIPQLPYLRAIVKETFRKHRTVPLLVPRKVEVDIEVCGFTVPKGTQVLVNAWGIGRDRRKRICPGLPLAMRMLHLMLGSLIFSFDWKLVDGISPKEMNMEEKFGFTLKKAQPLRVAPDIFIAGTETTSSTMEWAMAEILHNPKTLFEARVEFEKTIGKGKQVKESDIPQLSYLRAIVKETFRKHRTVPLLVPRKVEVDIEVCGFTVPKGTQVLVNAWGIGRDRSTWESPNLFMPERFLGSQVDV
ncbi:geraniol 8-hydroxylase-like [Camellia sinensis]|uniref:geraniol 8-hydroxylase-like n=1 Tax=Camellia sinensis TaxID=4442 RepID=UPI001035A049|nr:geraniol 8-hydroxylase-like [Camellia sinensis]